MRARGISSVLAATSALALLVAGPVMIYKGVDGRAQVSDQLTAQHITFPTEGLPKNLSGHAGHQVTTGPEAKAYADMVETHVLKATGGKTYSQVSAAYQATGGKDPQLGALRQTAFMGESLRGSLMGAYQAWMVSWLVIGLGALFLGLAVVFGAIAVTLRPTPVRVPASPEALESPHLTPR